MTGDAEAPAPAPSSLWEDEIPSTDNGFLRVGPAIPIVHTHEEDE